MNPVVVGDAKIVGETLTTGTLQEDAIAIMVLFDVESGYVPSFPLTITSEVLSQDKHADPDGTNLRKWTEEWTVPHAEITKVYRITFTDRKAGGIQLAITEERE